MDDIECLVLLDTNFKVSSSGIIYLRNKYYEPTFEEYEAIDHLCSEWDYAYIGDFEE